MIPGMGNDRSYQVQDTGPWGPSAPPGSSPNPPGGPITIGAPTANPAAQAFGLMRIRQLVRAGLLGGMPQGGTADTAAEWRTLSQGLGSNPAALAQFQAAASPVPHDPSAGAHQLASASPLNQLNAMATAKAVAKTMNHLRQLRPYGGPH